MRRLWLACQMSWFVLPLYFCFSFPSSNQLCLIPRDCLDKSLLFSLSRFFRSVCHCFLSMAENKWLAQGPPVGFETKEGLEHQVFQFQALCFNPYTKLTLSCIYRNKFWRSFPGLFSLLFTISGLGQGIKLSFFSHKRRRENTDPFFKLLNKALQCVYFQILHWSMCAHTLIHKMFAVPFAVLPPPWQLPVFNTHR